MEFISRIWDSALNIIFGAKETERLTGSFKSIQPQPFSEGSVNALLSYREPVVRKTLWLLKYRGNKQAAAACAEAIWQMMCEELSDEISMRGTGEILLIPIPNSKSKLWKKGFNQTRILAKILAEKDTSGILKYSKNVLYKIRDTEAQATIKDRKNRLKNIKDSMCAASEKTSGKTVFLIDDITTTGGTFKEATRALKNAGARRVVCFAIAH